MIASNRNEMKTFKEKVLLRFNNTESGSGSLTDREQILINICADEVEKIRLLFKQFSDRDEKTIDELQEKINHLESK